MARIIRDGDVLINLDRINRMSIDPTGRQILHQRNENTQPEDEYVVTYDGGIKFNVTQGTKRRAEYFLDAFMRPWIKSGNFRNGSFFVLSGDPSSPDNPVNYFEVPVTPPANNGGTF